MAQTIKPATSLPWALMDRASDGEYLAGITNMIGKSDPLYHAEAHATIDADAAQDAAYIVHACNSYPRLVDALRRVLDSGEINNDAASYLDGRALLREIGGE